MKRAADQQGRAGLELIEQAIHLLRRTSASGWASYGLGTVPFVLGGLYFWADMSRSAFASRHLASAALGMAVLFLWMKCCQALFLRYLRADLAGSGPPAFGLARCGRIFITQAALQPSGLFLLPLAVIPVVPFAWVYAFYQNLGALADGESAELRPLVKRSMQQASLWPGQNHLFLAIMIGFGFFMFLNWATVCFLLPGLVKMLFGVESDFTRGGTSSLNTTFFTVVCGLTYLCLDPMLKAGYALRCFYGESVQSGEDLKAELRPFVARAKALAVGVVFALVVAGTNTPANQRASALALEPSTSSTQTVAPGRYGPGAKTGAPGISPGISPPALERAIRETAQESKYTWRMPREKVIDSDELDLGIIGRFLKRAGNLIRQWLSDFANWLGNWLRKLFYRHRPSGPDGSGYGWILAQEVLMYGLVVLAAVGLGLLAYRLWRDRHRRTEAVASQAIQPAPDLSDESLGPEQLPEDGWTRLARELLARGELRLALRAFYLASLVHLADRNLISLARFKSNRDYERELHRRGHAFPELLVRFRDNVSVFDRTWYGLHEISSELVGEFAANVQRIKDAA